MVQTRSGFSLVVVLALTMALLLVGVGFANAVLQASRGARLGWQGDRTAHDADAALIESLRTWNAATASGLRSGESDSVLAVNTGASNTRVTRTRLNARTFALEAQSARTDDVRRTTRRSVGQVVVLDWPVVPVWAGMTSAGYVYVGDSITLLGADSEPAGWADECREEQRAEPSDALAAASADVAVGAVVSGAASGLRLLSAVEASALAADLDVVFAEVAAAAARVTTDSVVDLDVFIGAPACPEWFGDARRFASVPTSCTRRWPVVSVTHSGTTRLRGTTPAQGVLLVAGDLEIDAGVNFNGLLLVGGALRTVSGGAGAGNAGAGNAGATARHLTGAVVVRDVAASGSRLEAPILVQTSRCAVRLALAALGRPTPRRQHGWSERP